MDYKDMNAIGIVRLMLTDGVITVEQAAKYFPELAESEDEKIRKELIDYFKENNAALAFRCISNECVIAWLEKQGESTEINPSEFDLRLNKLLKQFESLPKVDLIGILSFYLNVVQNNGTYKEEKQGEQKPADKVEPKFHKDEWITNGDYTWKIVEVKPLDYILQSQDGNVVDDTISHVDEQFHSFTIEDAKDGDVLCTYECGKPKIVFILKGAPEKPYVLGFHCFYNIMYPYFEFDSEKGCLAPNKEDLKPATKEQCDLLFQKMKEADYEWDAEKKELKKIEKPAEWSEEDEEKINEIIDYLDYKGHKTDVEFLKSLKDRVLPNKLSEKDDNCICKIINWLDVCKAYNQDSKSIKEISEHIQWLKSLRPQNTWKPQKKQIVALRYVLNHLPYCTHKEEISGLLDQIKDFV